LKNKRTIPFNEPLPRPKSIQQLDDFFLIVVVGEFNSGKLEEKY